MAEIIGEFACFRGGGDWGRGRTDDGQRKELSAGGGAGSSRKPSDSIRCRRLHRLRRHGRNVFCARGKRQLMQQRRLAVAAMGGGRGLATAISPSHRRRRRGRRRHGRKPAQQGGRIRAWRVKTAAEPSPSALPSCFRASSAPLCEPERMKTTRRRGGRGGEKRARDGRMDGRNLSITLLSPANSLSPYPHYPPEHTKSQDPEGINKGPGGKP